MIPVEKLKDIALFAELPDEALRGLQALCHEGRYERGEEIFSEGGLADKLFVLEKGTVAIRIQRHASEDTLMVAAIRDKGSIMGWSAVVGTGRYTASAVCMDEVSVLEIDGEGLKRFIHEDCSTGVVILEALANVIASRLQATRAQLAGPPLSH